ncbi:uncharacterized protein LAESUDRAFT_185868 [Laetiporus sulphureus 93-53]|uniref:Uncharacterized protein n=1 Tax=Laetiporus sulphureus 93-53 TaxID=1314785 RepID=A0A165E4V9_9APHY|nr:uncharacterized protein LAESUDRAFT_185868 [Laetiporus sulphureus 93-53]KZT06245.1 hypothetical protein LAESUDRAFT_185868 [Laetiporus sulphureus 93-53]
MLLFLADITLLYVPVRRSSLIVLGAFHSGPPTDACLPNTQVNCRGRGFGVLLPAIRDIEAISDLTAHLKPCTSDNKYSMELLGLMLSCHMGDFCPIVTVVSNSISSTQMCVRAGSRHGFLPFLGYTTKGLFRAAACIWRVLMVCKIRVLEA